ncbi:MAG: FAD:protein FMN transferase [Oscillospiraceae bacterium]
MTRKLKLSLHAIAVCAVISLCGCAAIPTKPKASAAFMVMSTLATIQIEGERAQDAVDNTDIRLREFENKTSRFIETSDIGRLNAAAGNGEIEICKDTYLILDAAVRYADESNGMFDVTIGALTDIWKIGSDNPRVPSQSEIAAARSLVGIKGLALDERDGKYFASLERAGQKIDLGGIAKGYSLDLCRGVLEEYGIDHGFVSIGGNVLMFGDNGGEGFKVGVRYPEEGSSSSLCTLRLSDTVIATTGAYERFFVEDGTSYHHVIDPATGCPAVSDILSVSIVCPDGMRGDYLSTRLFLAGREGALELMRSGNVAAVLVCSDKHVYISRSLEESFIEEMRDPSYTFEFV